MKHSTKETITQALIEMLSETSLESLRIKDLIDRAHISKSTFYRQFLDKYDAANWIYKRIADEIVQSKPNLCNCTEWGRQLSVYMCQHRTLFRNICSYRGQNSFEEFLAEYFYANSIRYRKQPELMLTNEQDFAIHAYCYLSAHEHIRWIDNGFNPDFQTIQQLLHLCIPECVKEYF